MFIEEPALESIYHLVDSLISYLNTEEALSEKRKFQSILLLFKKDPIHQVDFFRDQMINFIKKLIKLSAVPNPSHILKSFKCYINHYITDLNNQDDSDVNKCFKNENEEAYNSFLLREGQKRSTKDYYKFLQEFEKIKHENMMLERNIEEYNQIINRLNDEIIYLNNSKAESELKIEDKYDENTRRKMEDLMFLIDQINEELKDDNNNSDPK